MNNMCSQEDKKCLRPYPQAFLNGFLAVLEECSLADMNLHGYPYT